MPHESTASNVRVQGCNEHSHPPKRHLTVDHPSAQFRQHVFSKCGGSCAICEPVDNSSNIAHHRSKEKLRIMSQVTTSYSRESPTQITSRRICPFVNVKRHFFPAAPQRLGRGLSPSPFNVSINATRSSRSRSVSWIGSSMSERLGRSMPPVS